MVKNEDQKRPLKVGEGPLKMSMARKLGGWTLLGGALALIASACGSSASASQGSSGTSKSPITFQLWESHNGGPVGGAVTHLADTFNATHKSVKVQVIVTKASSKLEAAIASGSSPVLAEISHYDGTFVKSGTLVSWNQFMKGNSLFSQSNFYPGVWKNGDVGGQHYRLEVDAKLSEVFYNESLFAKAGITTPPSTWSQLAQDAAKLKPLGVIPIGWKDSSAHILPAFMSNGGTMLKGSNSIGTAVNFDNTAGTTTFNQFHSMYANGLLTFDHGTTLRSDLASGHMAMIDGTSAGYQKVLDAVNGAFKVGAFVEPAGTTGHAYNLIQGLGFVMPKGHAKAQELAAWTFVNWWFEPAQQVYWDENTGYAPEQKTTTNAIPSSFLSSHPGLAASISAIESPYSFPRPVSDSYNQVQAVLDAEFLDAVTGQASTSSALSTLNQQGNSYMSGASAL